MESIIRSDIFFFITSISVVIFTVFLIIIGFYFVRIMRNFSKISDTLKNAVDDTNIELREMVEHVRESSAFSFVFGNKKKKKKSTK